MTSGGSLWLSLDLSPSKSFFWGYALCCATSGFSNHPAAPVGTDLISEILEEFFNKRLKYFPHGWTRIHTDFFLIRIYLCLSVGIFSSVIVLRRHLVAIITGS